MAYIVTKKPWLGALFVLIFGPLGLLYYSWKKALIAFLLFFLPNLLLYSLDSIVGEAVRWGVQILMAAFAYLDLKGKLSVIADISSKILPVVTIPIVFLNFFAEIVGGIWLLFLGQWRMVLGVFLFTLFVPWAYSIVGLIQMPLMALLVFAKNRNRKNLALTTGFLSIFVTHVIILIYVFFVIDTAISVSLSRDLSIIACLLFGYGVATGPFSYMASKEGPDAIASFLGVFVSQVSYIILATTYLVDFPAIAIPIILLIVFGIEIFQLSIVSKAWDYERDIQPFYDYQPDQT